MSLFIPSSSTACFYDVSYAFSYDNVLKPIFFNKILQFTIITSSQVQVEKSLPPAREDQG
jgi:hypothetical protein